jgi:hypothetical protein
VYVALKVGHPVDDEDDPDYQVHLTEWTSYQRLGAVMNEVVDIQQYGIAEGAEPRLVPLVYISIRLLCS